MSRRRGWAPASGAKAATNSGNPISAAASSHVPFAAASSWAFTASRAPGPSTVRSATRCPAVPVRRATFQCSLGAPGNSRDRKSPLTSPVKGGKNGAGGSAAPAAVTQTQASARPTRRREGRASPRPKACRNENGHAGARPSLCGPLPSAATGAEKSVQACLRRTMRIRALKLAEVARQVIRRTETSPTLAHRIGIGWRFQISFAYSRMVRSLENLPMRAVLRIAMRAHWDWSR